MKHVEWLLPSLVRLSLFKFFVSFSQSFFVHSFICDWCASEYFTQLRTKNKFPHYYYQLSRLLLVPFTRYICVYVCFFSFPSRIFCIHLPTIFIINEWALVRVRQHRRNGNLNCRLMLNIISNLCIDTIKLKVRIKITSKKKNTRERQRQRERARVLFFCWKKLMHLVNNENC